MYKQLLLITIFSIALNLQAQEGKHIGSFKIKKIDLITAVEKGEITNFSTTYFVNQLESDPDSPFKQISFANNDLTLFMHNNPTYNFELTLSLPKREKMNGEMPLVGHQQE